MGGDGTDFVLFTHHKKARDGIALSKTYKDLREAVLELYLSVKIRSDDEIDDYNERFFLLEKQELANFTGYELIDLIKECVERLM